MASQKAIVGFIIETLSLTSSVQPFEKKSGHLVPESPEHLAVVVDSIVSVVPHELLPHCFHDDV